MGAVLADRHNGERLIPGEFFTESPARRVERIERGAERIGSVEQASAFGSFLFSHNIQVAFLAFSLGALGLVGGVALLFKQGGVTLGATPPHCSTTSGLLRPVGRTAADSVTRFGRRPAGGWAFGVSGRLAHGGFWCGGVSVCGCLTTPVLVLPGLMRAVFVPSANGYSLDRRRSSRGLRVYFV
jgi:hypothetical protein